MVRGEGIKLNDEWDIRLYSTDKAIGKVWFAEVVTSEMYKQIVKYEDFYSPDVYDNEIDALTKTFENILYSLQQKDLVNLISNFKQISSQIHLFMNP